MIIGLCGRKRSGKGSAATALVKQGFVELAFADKLKELTAHFYKNHDGYEACLADVKSDAFKERGVFGLSSVAIWTGPSIVISYVRYWTELRAIKAAGGIVLRLNRNDRMEPHVFDNGGVGAKACQHNWCMRDTNGVWLTGDAERSCGLPASSHPSHFSGDTHESETQLPDESEHYSASFSCGSGEEAAASVENWLKEYKEMMK